MDDTAKIFIELQNTLGCSAKVLARLIGSNECSIYNFRLGKTKPRFPKIMKRAIALQKLLDYLLNNPDYLINVWDKLDISE